MDYEQQKKHHPVIKNMVVMLTNFLFLSVLGNAVIWTIMPALNPGRGEAISFENYKWKFVSGKM